MAIFKHFVHEAEEMVSHFRLPLKVAPERHEMLQCLGPVIGEPLTWILKG